MSQKRRMRRLAYQKMWHKNETSVPHPTRLSTMLLEPSAEQNLHFRTSKTLQKMLFTSIVSLFIALLFTNFYRTWN